MASEIPDFKDWTELKEKKRVNYFNDKLFSEFRSYIKYEPIDKIFSGICIYFKGKEVLKIWVVLSSPGKETQKLAALLLEDGNWAVSLPIYNNHDGYNIFNIQGDVKSRRMKISILTESGWKSRTIIVE